MGIFLEGERKWNGTTDLKDCNATAKLIKKLNVPVITIKIKGGYLACPRWAKYSRRGNIELSYTLFLTKEEVSELSLKQIEERTKENLTHDEVVYQKQVYN